MSAIYGISYDLGLLVLVCLPAIIAFWRGEGIFRFFSLACCLVGFALSLQGSARGGGEGLYYFVHLIPGWIIGSVFAALAINEAKFRKRP